MLVVPQLKGPRANVCEVKLLQDNLHWFRGQLMITFIFVTCLPSICTLIRTYFEGRACDLVRNPLYKMGRARGF